MSKPTNRAAQSSHARPLYPPGPSQNMPAGANNAVPLRGQPLLPPWTPSPVLGGEFVYVPSTDELFMRDGRRLPRPARMQPAQLASSTYTGPLPPPTQLPQFPFVNTGSPPTGNMPLHPGSPPNIASAMGHMNLNHRPQTITSGTPINVVFNHGGSESAIQRGDPPKSNAPVVKIDKPELRDALFKEYKVRPRPREFFTISTLR